MGTTTIAVLHSTIRKEEKLILDAARERRVDVRVIDIREAVFNPDTYQVDFDIALERSVSTVKGTYAAAFLESLGVIVINPSSVARVCEDKFLTSLLLSRARIPTPGFAMAFSVEQALQAVDELGGFPVVVKPPLGSWGRLLAKVNDVDSLEAVLEHKEVLGSPQQKGFYIQEFVRKPGRDIRAFVIEGEVLCAIYRESLHWITNTARGSAARNCPVTEELRQICRSVSQALGGGILALDLFETPEGLKINEVNHTMEFRNSEEPTGVRISMAILDHCLSRANSCIPHLAAV
jgi:[lysine-biosynthesis-protein LysW]--L-2-aminoadipate ligase